MKTITKFSLLTLIALAAAGANATSCGIGGTTHWVNGRCEPIAQPSNVQAGAGATATSGPQSQQQQQSTTSQANPITTVSPSQSSADKALYLNVASGGAVVGLVPPAPGMCQRSHSEAKVRRVNLLIIGFDFQDAVSDSFTDLDCVDKYFDHQRAVAAPAPTLRMDEPIHPVDSLALAPAAGLQPIKATPKKKKVRKVASKLKPVCPAGEVLVCRPTKS